MSRASICGKAILVLTFGVWTVLVPAVRSGPALTARVSVSSTGEQGNGPSFPPTSISADGRLVAFSSGASNLVPEVSTPFLDVFVHDRLSGQTEIVSVNNMGQAGNSTSGQFGVVISSDGRFVAFESFATNLVSDDRNQAVDVFVRDRVMNVTVRVSVGSLGRLRANQGNSGSGDPTVNASGRFVAFMSFSSNLVLGDTNGTADVFVRDRDPDGDGQFDEPGTGLTTRVSVATGGGQANGTSLRPSISADGRFVAFASDASNLVPGDMNAEQDIFVHDRLTGVTSRVSVSSDGTEANSFSQNPAISDDSGFVAFNSPASNLVHRDTNGVNDVFVHDRLARTTVRVSIATSGREANGESNAADLDADGGLVSFASAATNLVAGDTNGVFDVYVHDRVTGITRRESVNSAGVQANGASLNNAISADGAVLAFYSSATDLVPGDTNGFPDTFIHLLQ